MGLNVLGARLQHFVRVLHRLRNFLPVQSDGGEGILGLDDVRVRPILRKRETLLQCLDRLVRLPGIQIDLG